MDGNQTRLHQTLKELYASATGGETEVNVRVGDKKYRIDVLDQVAGNAYEIQIKQFGKAFYPKIQALSSLYNVIIIHPVPVVQHVTTWEHGLASQHVVRKRQDFYSIFERLVSFRAPDVIGKIQVRVLLVEERVTRQLAGFHGRRPYYEVLDRDLVRVVGERTYSGSRKFLAMLPSGLPCEFTNNDVAAMLDIKGGRARKKKIAGCMTYSFCQLGLARRTGKRGNAHVFSIVESPSIVSSSC
nr:hypothetical protein [Candidatus Sigynarchaeota archaeon]